MDNKQNPHIISTENMQNLDGSPVAAVSDYTEPAAVSYQRRIRVLAREEAAISERIEAFCESPTFTDRQKQLIREYRKEGRYRFRYRSIKKSFILPYSELLAKHNDLQVQLADFCRRYREAPEGHPELLEQLKAIIETDGNADE